MRILSTILLFLASGGFAICGDMAGKASLDWGSGLYIGAAVAVFILALLQMLPLITEGK